MNLASYGANHVQQVLTRVLLRDSTIEAHNTDNLSSQGQGGIDKETQQL